MSSEGSGIAYGSGSNINATVHSGEARLLGHQEIFKQLVDNLERKSGIIVNRSMECLHTKRKFDKSPQVEGICPCCSGITTLPSTDPQAYANQMVTLDIADGDFSMSVNDFDRYGLALLPTDARATPMQNLADGSCSIDGARASKLPLDIVVDAIGHRTLPGNTLNTSGQSCSNLEMDNHSNEHAPQRSPDGRAELLYELPPKEVTPACCPQKKRHQPARATRYSKIRPNESD